MSRPVHDKFRLGDIKEVVNLPEWQELRKSFIGTWKKTPEENVAKLHSFLGSISETDDRKLRIVHNYLTGSGFRSGNISHPSITKLLNQVREEVKRRK
jgi:hypothetical protein